MILVLGKVDNGALDEAVEDAYFLKCNQTVSVRLPFDATGMRCSLCQNYMLNPVEDYAFSVTDHTTCVDITPAAASKWIVFYK